ANNGGWQWSAGTGTDAAPYFRIFNPTTQAEKHDPQGTYIRRWLPELEAVPNKYIHKPWEMPQEVQRGSHCLIGEDYPSPIVDHAEARERALKTYG
ncbi:MAG: FAD-binding domain-containing protein, partial [Anaerolineales bacterium]